MKKIILSLVAIVTLTVIVYSCKKETPSQLNSQNIDQKQYENYQAYTDKLAKSLKTKEKANYEVTGIRIAIGVDLGFDCGFKYECGKCPGLCIKFGLVAKDIWSSDLPSSQFTSGQRDIYVVNSNLNKSTEKDIDIYLTDLDIVKDGKFIIYQDMKVFNDDLIFKAGEYTVDYSDYTYGKVTVKAIQN